VVTRWDALRPFVRHLVGHLKHPFLDKVDNLFYQSPRVVDQGWLLQYILMEHRCVCRGLFPYFVREIGFFNGGLLEAIFFATILPRCFLNEKNCLDDRRRRLDDGDMHRKWRLNQRATINQISGGRRGAVATTINQITNGRKGRSTATTQMWMRKRRVQHRCVSSATTDGDQRCCYSYNEKDWHQHKEHIPYDWPFINLIYKLFSEGSNAPLYCY